MRATVNCGPGILDDGLEIIDLWILLHPAPAVRLEEKSRRGRGGKEPCLSDVNGKVTCIRFPSNDPLECSLNRQTGKFV